MSGENNKLFKEKLEEILKQPVYTTKEVAQIASNLGTKVDSARVLKDIKERKIDYESLGVKKSLLDTSTFVYAESVVWGYLKTLEKQGQIDLEEMSIDQIKKLGYFNTDHERNVGPTVEVPRYRNMEDFDV